MMLISRIVGSGSRAVVSRRGLVSSRRGLPLKSASQLSTSSRDDEESFRTGLPTPTSASQLSQLSSSRDDEDEENVVQGVIRTSKAPPAVSHAVEEAPAVWRLFLGGAEAVELGKRIKQLRTTNELLAIAEENCGVLDAVNIATVIRRLGRSYNKKVKRDPRFLALFDLAKRSLDAHPKTWGPQQLATAAWGVARVDMGPVFPAEFFEKVNNLALAKLDFFEPQDLSYLLWARATALELAEGDELFHRAADDQVFPYAVRALNPSMLADTIWSFQHVAPELTRRKNLLNQAALALSDVSATVISDFRPHDLAQLAWTLSFAEPRDESDKKALEALFEAIADAAFEVKEDLKADNTSRLAAAFARARHLNMKLFSGLARLATQNAEKWGAAQLASMALAYVESGYSAQSMLKALALAVYPKLAKCTQNDLLNLSRAFCQEPHKVAGPLLEALADESRHRLAEEEEQGASDLVALAWAFATALGNDRGNYLRSAAPLLGDLAGALKPRLTELRPNELSTLAWAYSTASVESPQLLAEIARLAAPQVEDFETADLADLAWAVVAAGVDAPELFAALAKRRTKPIVTPPDDPPPPPAPSPVVVGSSRIQWGEMK